MMRTLRCPFFVSVRLSEVLPPGTRLPYLPIPFAAIRAVRCLPRLPFTFGPCPSVWNTAVPRISCPFHHPARTHIRQSAPCTALGNVSCVLRPLPFVPVRAMRLPCLRRTQYEGRGLSARRSFRAMWRARKKAPCRSRGPYPFRRRTRGAYSPATFFWCSAMTLSATGWGASS